MAFQHGKKGRVYGTGVDLSGFLRSAGSSGSADTAETSTMGSDDKTFLNGLVEGSLSLEGIFSAAPDGSSPKEVEDVLTAALGGDDIVLCHLPQGDGFGKTAYGFKGIQNAVEITSPVDDVVQITGELTSNSGLKSARILHAKGSENAGTSQSTHLDNTLGTTKGGAAFLQLFGVNNPGVTTAAVIIQHSIDNSTWVDLATFPVLNAQGAAALLFPDGTTVARYLRARWTISVGGTAEFFAAFARR